eukprot:1119251-Rhodomonas_salina.2
MRSGTSSSPYGRPHISHVNLMNFQADAVWLFHRYFEVESAYIKWKDDIEKEEQADRSVGVHASLEVGR